jgi:hypothetical protein
VSNVGGSGDGGGKPRHAHRHLWNQALRADQRVEKTLMLVIFAAGSYADDISGKKIFPGVPRLAADTGLGESTVRRHLTTAVELGYLTLARRGGRSGDGQRRANEYVRSLPTDLDDTSGQPLADEPDETGQPLGDEPSTAHFEAVNRSPAGGHQDIHSIIPSSTPRAPDEPRSVASVLGTWSERNLDRYQPQPWCGRCDKRTRMRNQVVIDDNDRGGLPYYCPDCNPFGQRTAS